MLEVKGLSAAYGQHPALNKASVRVGKGEIVVILGANGAGKSTLLKAISGICEGKVTGSVRMNGHELVGMNFSGSLIPTTGRGSPNHGTIWV